MIGTFVYATFAAAVLILGGEFLNEAKNYRLVGAIVQSIGTLTAVFLLPLLYVFVTKEEGFVGTKWGVRRLIFHSLSWLFYTLCIFMTISVGMGWWKFV